MSLTSAGVVRRGHAAVAGHHLAVAGDQVLVEIPQRLAPGGLRELAIQRVGLARRARWSWRTSETSRHRCSRRSRRSAVLPPVSWAKSLEGKPSTTRPAVPVLGIERLQALVLGREAAIAGGVDDQQHLAAVLAQGLGLFVLQPRESVVQGRRTGRRASAAWPAGAQRSAEPARTCTMAMRRKVFSMSHPVRRCVIASPRKHAGLSRLFAHARLKCGPVTKDAHALSRTVQATRVRPLGHGQGHSVGAVRRGQAVGRAGADHQDERHHRVVGPAGHRDVPARQPGRQRLLGLHVDLVLRGAEAFAGADGIPQALPPGARARPNRNCTKCASSSSRRRRWKR